MASMCLFFFSCSIVREEKFEDWPHVNICVFGNSYSNDSFCYVPFILKQYGITCSIHIYCRPGGSLQDLDREWEKGHSSLLYFHIDTRTEKKWNSSVALTAGEILSLEEWDIVSLQQASLKVRVKDSYSPYLENIVDRIEAACQYKFNLAWFMAYNRANVDAGQENLDVQRSVVDRGYFGMILPVATAIFNCQAHPKLKLVGDSIYGKMYSSDNVHLQEGLPCYTASLAIVEALLREYSPGQTVIGDKIRPIQQWVDAIGAITPNGISTGVNDGNCLLAQKAAVNANDNYFEIVPME